ncbi:hypothetical protein DFH06DRAFT_1463517 [Mycena polygramma]|nr:hypothetical protein DFH06DRAFT_1463517 [Mycena polygramma]
MSTSSKPQFFYGIHRGRVPGVYSSWEECKLALAGSRHPRHKKFLTMEDAKEYVATGSIPKGASYTEMHAGVKRPASAMDERERGPSSRPMKDEPIDLTLDDDAVVPEETGVVYVHGYGWSKDEGEGASPFAGIAVWWGAKDPRNITERCPGEQSIHCASLVAVLRALETVPRGKRPIQIISSSKYATDCINSWLPRWLKNGFKGWRNEQIKHEALLRCIATHLDERRHAGQVVRLVYVPVTADDAASRTVKAAAKRGAQQAPVPARDYDQLAAAARARITGPPVPIARQLESHLPAPYTPPQKRQRVEPTMPALAPAHAALAAAMYSPRKMAILAQAAAILAMPPLPPPSFALAPALGAAAAAPPPPVWAARPVVRSKVPLPGRRKAVSHAPPPPPIHAASAEISPYAALLKQHGLKNEPR